MKIGRVSNIRFITDSIGKLQGTFQVPDPDRQANPRWETGTKTLKFTTSNTNSLIAGTVTSSAESNFYAQGELQTVRETVLSTRIPQIRRIDHTEQRVQRGRITRQQGPDRLTVNTETLMKHTNSNCAIDTQRVNNVDLNVTEVTTLIEDNLLHKILTEDSLLQMGSLTSKAAYTRRVARNLNRVERFWGRPRRRVESSTHSERPSCSNVYCG